MKLLTDGTEKDPILGFCQKMISQHGENWPVSEEVLAEGFVNWLKFSSFLTRDALRELCRSRAINLSFIPLPEDIRGFNCSLHNKREIVITLRETAPFADSHTLCHEFREMLEHGFTELGYPTIGAKDSLEVQAEQFAMLCRMEAAMKELPYFLEMAGTVEKKWARYLTYALVILFGLAHVFGCIMTPQMEETLSEARRQR